MSINDYKDLRVWQQSFALATEVYRLTEGFPGRERFGITSQIRRAAISLPSNIAEGYGRNSTADYLRFLKMAMGSAYELETQLLLSRELGYSTDPLAQTALNSLKEIMKMLNALIRSVKASRSQK